MKDLSKIYNHLYQKEYGVSNRFQFVVELIKTFSGKKILDLGCGKGTYSVILEGMGYDVMATDIIDRDLVNFENYYISTDYKYRKVESIMCLDVLEHIPEEEVPTMLKAMYESCEQAFITISHYKAHNKGPNGEELHLTVKPPLWWERKLIEAGFEPFHYEEVTRFGMSVYGLKGKLRADK
jgi:cyclopropane fatty-acyl-phospholipid synthase-like methyltransferase